MHPYRATTDENGVAKVKVTKGRYDILVSAVEIRCGSHYCRGRGRHDLPERSSMPILPGRLRTRCLSDATTMSELGRWEKMRAHALIDFVGDLDDWRRVGSHHPGCSGPARRAVPGSPSRPVEGIGLERRLYRGSEQRGEELNASACAECHGLQLNGAGQPDMPPSPAIARASFLRKWAGQTAAALFVYGFRWLTAHARAMLTAARSPCPSRGAPTATSAPAGIPQADRRGRRGRRACPSAASRASSTIVSR